MMIASSGLREFCRAQVERPYMTNHELAPLISDTLQRMCLSTLRRRLIFVARKCQDQNQPLDYESMMEAGTLLEGVL
jgi:hypothetical protein